MFKKMRSINLPYQEQGEIYFTCLNYSSKPETVQRNIDSLCAACGGDYRDALFETVTTNQSIDAVALKHNLSPSMLYRLRKNFYETWDNKKIKGE
jgi:hypothetical protein